MKRTPLARRSPRRRTKRLSLRAKKSLHPERFCARDRCARPATRIGRCATHAKEHLDHIWAAAVRSDVCEAAAWHARWLPCAGRIEACHKIRREYLNTRWLRSNGFSGCHAVNYWMELHPLEADLMLRDWRGDEYENLRRLALSSQKPDYAAIAATLGAAS